MIEMGMGDEDMADALPRVECAHNGREMSLVIGAGVNHRKPPVAQQIGIGAPEGHRRGVGRENAPQVVADPLRFSDTRFLLLICSHRSFFRCRPGIGLAMSLRWLKPYMPRGLFGRATLILLLPVITLLLVVSIVFSQRHFEGVTQQMTETVAREIRATLREQDRGGEGWVARTLGISLRE